MGQGDEEPIYETVGEPNADGSCSLRAFEVNNLLGQRYEVTATGLIVSVSAYFNATTAATFRGAVYADSAGPVPGALLAQTAQAAVGGTIGWHEFDVLTSVGVEDGEFVWIAFNSSASINSCSGSPLGATHRRLRTLSFAMALPDPFASTANYSNTRGMRMKIWTNPP